MKAAFAMAASAAVVSASQAHHPRHNAHHGMFEGINKRGEAAESCECSTVYTTYYGSPTLSFPPAPPPTTTTTSTSTGTITTTVTPTPTTPPAVTVPTPIAHTCETPGTYTFPATTVVITSTTNACVPESTPLPSGTHTYGGVTTVVETATTVTCPYATVTTSNGVETSVVETTTYVCPEAGTYTIAPTTTVCPSDTTVTYPVVTEYPPGTYTAPAVITTVVDTNTVVYCPFDTPTPTPVPTTEAPPAPKPTTTEAPPAPKPTHTKTKTPSNPYPTGKPDTGLGGTPGKPWGTTFTPYRPDGSCMSQSEVSLSIAALAAMGLDTVRTYSTDCNTLEYVSQACKDNGVKMMVGIYIDQPGCSANDPTISEQIQSLKSWAQWDLVPLVIVGNEAGLDGFCTPAELAGLISQCRSEFTGYTGPFTTADTVNMWQQSDYAAALCPVVDVVGANAHAFFDLGTTAPEAGQFVQSQLDLLDNICSGKKSYILESGWPSAGNAQGLAVPGVSQQVQAINSIIQTCGDRVILFSLFNDDWKSGATACACEQHFGCASVLGVTLPSLFSG